MKKTLNEEVARIKSIMNINEDASQAMAMLQQYTDEFNQEAEEDLTTEELQDVACAHPDSMEAPEEAGNEEKQKLEEFKARLKAAVKAKDIAGLKEAKRQLKELKKQAKQQQNEQVGAMVTVLGVTMPHTFALVIGGIMLLFVLNALLSIFNIHLIQTVTSFCTGRQRTSWGIGFGRNR